MSSDAIEVDLHVFACGHGDTLLLKLPAQGRTAWILIDCNLPKYDGTLGSFLDYTAKLGISRLDYVFQTHPDRDHFLGMAEVLGYFTRDGRSVGHFADGGQDCQQAVKTKLAGHTGERAYDRLQDALDDLEAKGLLEFFEVTADTRTVSPRGFKGRVDLIPLAPRATRKRALQRNGVARIAADPNTKPTTNELSIVLGLTVRDADRTLNVLLAADTDAAGVQSALELWRTRLDSDYSHERPTRTTGFQVVKVPHHGSAESHAPELTKEFDRAVRHRVACVSCGTRRALPSREVLKAFHDEDWAVLVTTKRLPNSGGGRHDRALFLASASSPKQMPTTRNTLRIRWSSQRGLRWGPKVQTVLGEELVAYDP
jgi:beta-lactamase superfamily II metal-dependent hydrolase